MFSTTIAGISRTIFLVIANRKEYIPLPTAWNTATARKSMPSSGMPSAKPCRKRVPYATTSASLMNMDMKKSLNRKYDRAIATRIETTTFAENTMPSFILL